LSIITAEFKHYTTEEPLYPGGPMSNVFHITTHDKDTGRQLSADETRELFARNEIIGVHVKMKSKWLIGDMLGGRPMNAIITDITDDSIILGDEGIPKGLFHEWYELD
jgi:hypothetical protein